jgi:hypothetical protein
MKNIWFTHFCICVSFFLPFTSCKKGSNGPNPITPKKNVYVAGQINDRAVYWKDGIMNILADTNASTWSYGICVFPTENDVYVCGASKINGFRYAVYWKNGMANYLRKDSSCYAASIITSGDDVYTTGAMVYDGPNINPQNTKAVYWKNGKMSFLSQNISFANHIAISGHDVYITGGEIINGITRAMFWKNGIPIYLADTAINSYAADVFVVNNDVYIGGTEKINGNNVALYWKNSIAYSLNEPFSVQSIFVYDNNVYFLEEENLTGDYFYRKNGTTNKVTNCYFASSMYILANDIYVAGLGTSNSSGGYYATIWKNGQSVRLSEMQSAAYSVYVK